MGSSNAVCATGIGWHKKKNDNKTKHERTDRSRRASFFSFAQSDDAERRKSAAQNDANRPAPFPGFYFYFFLFFIRQTSLPRRVAAYFFATALFTIYPFFSISFYSHYMQIKAASIGEKSEPSVVLFYGHCVFFFREKSNTALYFDKAR